MATDDGAITDREAILARRALFISSALAALSCSPGPKAPVAVTEGGRDPGSVASTAKCEERANEGHLVVGEELSQLPAWTTVARGIPPLDVPSGLDQKEAEALTEQAANMRAHYDRLQRLWISATTVCESSETECTMRWSTFSCELESLRVWALRLQPNCGYPIDTVTALVHRTKSHQDFLVSTLRQLRLAAHDDYDSRDVSDPSKRTYAVVSAYPTPCLQCSGEPTVDLDALALTFAMSSADLGMAEDLEVLDSIARSLRADPKTRLEVRGHCDPQEGPAVKALARARAEAVVQALIERGVKPNRLVVRPMGGRLRVDSSATEATRRRNQRVDFEIIR